MAADQFERRCDGVTRREVLRVGGLSALGLTLSDWLRLRAVAEPQGRKSAKACILIWLDGGPSHLDLFDLKPDAPAEVRGPFTPIASRVPGIELSEYLPRTAVLADKLALVRSMTSTLGEHNFGSHYLLTGYKPSSVLRYPSYGSVLVAARDGAGMLPSYIAVPDANAMAAEGFLPARCRPFAVTGDPAKPEFKVRDLDLYPGMIAGRLTRRRDFLAAFDRFHEQTGTHRSDRISAGAGPSDPQFEQAYRLITAPEAKRAFDLAAEPADVRQRYGPRTIGQACLLARRLVEAGVPFVTVTDRGWDTHEAIFHRLKEGYTGGSVGLVPMLDLAYSALLGDLADRGLLDETLVILMGEFGRTPRLNPSGGRDHWPRVFSVVLAGGGVPGGQVIGASDAHGESPADRPVLPESLARTIYTLLGIDPDREFVTAAGRPVRVNAGSECVQELLG